MRSFTFYFCQRYQKVSGFKGKVFFHLNFSLSKFDFEMNPDNAVF